MKKVLLFFLFLVTLFFYRSVIFSEIPMPGDHLLGVYYPWLDYKWPGFPTGVPVKNPLLADVPSLFYPLKIYSMGLFKSGIFPSWNPLIFNGYPLLATFQSGVLNPFNIYFLFFNHSVAWTLYIATQPFLSLLFMYFLLRALKLSRISSVMGAVVYGFCGFNLLWLEYGIHGYVAAFIPLLFLLVYQKRYLFASVILAAQLFSGYPQISLYTIIFLGFWVLWLAGRPKLPIILKYSGFVILGISLAGMLIIPGFELFKLSQRVGEPLAGLKSEAFYPYRQLITLLAPDFYGNPSTYNTWGGMQYTNNTGYASVIALVLAMAALILNRRRHRFFFSALYLIPIFLSLPTPVSYFIQKLPLFSAAVMSRVMVFSGFALAVLSAIGLDELVGQNYLRLNKLKPLLLPVIIILIVAALAMIGSNPGRSVALRNLFFPFICLLVIYISILLMIKIPKLKNLAVTLVLAATVLELFRFGWKYNSFFPAGLIFPPTKITDYLQKHPEYRLDGGDVLPLSVWMAYGLESGSGYDAVYPGIWSQYLGAVDNGNLSHAKGRLGDVTNYNSRLLDISGTGFILALKRSAGNLPSPTGTPNPAFKLAKLVPVFTDGTVVVYQNKLALPKFSLKSSYEIVNQKSAIITRLLDPQFDFSAKLILDQALTALPTAFGTGQLTVISDLPGHQLFNVSATGPVFLLNTQNFYPGWQAVIDGHQVPILNANFAFQTVLVPAGNHLLEFTYRPLSIIIGASTSIISVIIFFGLHQIFRRRIT